jgi:DNA-binding NarL/FixJ family response regulator
MSMPLAGDQNPAIQDLTSREREVGELLAEGLATKAIAARLGISLHTVRRHTERIFRKLCVQSRTLAALRFREMRPERRSS